MDITKNSENQKNINNNSSNNNNSEWYENRSSSPYSATTMDDYSNFTINNDTKLKSEETSTIEQIEIPKSQYQIIVEPSLCRNFW